MLAKRFTPNIAIREHADPAVERQGREATGILTPSQGDRDLTANPGSQRGPDSRRIDNRRQHRPGVAGFQQCGHDGIAVARSSRTGRVGRIGQNYRPLGTKGLFDRFLQRQQRDLHRLVILPEQLGQLRGQFFGHFRVTVGHDETVGSQVRHIREGIADHHSGSQANRGRFDLLAKTNALTEPSGFGDQFISPHQGRNLHTSRHRTHLPVEDPQQQPCGTFTGRPHINMWVRVIEHDGIAVTDHAIGQDAMKVQRHNQRDVVAENPPSLGKQMPFRIRFPLGGHRSMKTEIGSIDPGVVLQ